MSVEEIEIEIEGERGVNLTFKSGNNDLLVNVVEVCLVGSQSEASVNRPLPLRRAAV